MKKLFLLAIGAVFAIALLMVATPSMAVHKGSGDLTCGNCHTMHSSQGGTDVSSMGGDFGSLLLLRKLVSGRAEIHNFCLMCHSENGDNGNIGYASAPNNTGTTRPPKVHLDPAWTGGDLDTVGAGGDFGTTLTYDGDTSALQSSGSDWDDTVSALGRGHSLGLGDVQFGGPASGGTDDAIPPGNSGSGQADGTAIPYLTCTSCHDPHGTAVTTENINVFRNLKAGPYMDGFGNAGTFVDSVENVWTTMSLFGDLAGTYVGGAAGSIADGTNPGGNDNIWPVWQSSNTQNRYFGDSTADQETGIAVGFSRFCAQCHGSWHEATVTNATFPNNQVGEDWARHPTQRSLVDTGSVVSGGGITIVDKAHYDDSDVIPVGRKLPAADNCAAGAPFVQGDCSSEPYYADDDGDKVFCLSCHFSHAGPWNDDLKWDYTSAVSAGSQIGLGIASNIGCQQCHNR